MAAPRTKLEKEIVALSEELPGLTEDQVTYLKEKLFWHRATLLKSGKITCLDCGHQWKNNDPKGMKVKKAECPECQRKLEVVQTMKRVFEESVYFQVIDTFKGYQVVRMFEAEKRFSRGKPQRFWYRKIYENWISKDGKVKTMGMFIISKWNANWGGGFELRPNGASCNSNYRIGLKSRYVYPKKKFIPTLKRNGIKTSIQGIEPTILFKKLLSDPKAETIFKAGQYDLIKQEIDIDRYWPSIKICIRNNYIPKDTLMWRDYMSFLICLGKDVLNPKYACPENLLAAHDKAMYQYHNLQKKKRLEERIERAKRDEKEYKIKQARYTGLRFSEEDIEISFIESPYQLAQESSKLRHCAFESNYHKDKDALLFSVRNKGELLATAQVSISKRELIQLRGLQNCIIDQDKKVREMFDRNMPRILNPRVNKSNREVVDSFGNFAIPTEGLEYSYI